MTESRKPLNRFRSKNKLTQNKHQSESKHHPIWLPFNGARGSSEPGPGFSRHVETEHRGGGRLIHQLPHPQSRTEGYPAEPMPSANATRLQTHQAGNDNKCNNRKYADPPSFPRERWGCPSGEGAGCTGHFDPSELPRTGPHCFGDGRVSDIKVRRQARTDTDDPKNGTQPTGSGTPGICDGDIAVFWALARWMAPRCHLRRFIRRACHGMRNATANTSHRNWAGIVAIRRCRVLRWPYREGIATCRVPPCGGTFDVYACAWPHDTVTKFANTWTSLRIGHSAGRRPARGPSFSSVSGWEIGFPGVVLRNLPAFWGRVCYRLRHVRVHRLSHASRGSCSMHRQLGRLPRRCRQPPACPGARHGL